MIMINHDIMDLLFRLQNFEIVNLSRIFESISYA